MDLYCFDGGVQPLPAMIGVCQRKLDNNVPVGALCEITVISPSRSAFDLITLQPLTYWKVNAAACPRVELPFAFEDSGECNGNGTCTATTAPRLQDFQAKTFLFFFNSRQQSASSYSKLPQHPVFYQHRVSIAASNPLVLHWLQFNQPSVRPWALSINPSG